VQDPIIYLSILPCHRTNAVFNGTLHHCRQIGILSKISEYLPKHLGKDFSSPNSNIEKSSTTIALSRAGYLKHCNKCDWWGTIFESRFCPNFCLPVLFIYNQMVEGIRKFTTTNCHWPRTWAPSIYLPSSQSTSLRSTLILSYHILLGLPSGRFLRAVPVKIQHWCHVSAVLVVCTAYLTPLDFTWFF
jgi:hypothetical protein